MGIFFWAKVHGVQNRTEPRTNGSCGTPSYVAPEILKTDNYRKYTRAVDIWSLGVVLYVCLCGFPPFDDDRYSKDFPYKMVDQIQGARFEFPSPYWDSVSYAAHDLIDLMLTVDVDERITVDECLKHPWMTNRRQVSASDSTDNIAAGLRTLDFSSRKPVRERTMLSSITQLPAPRPTEASPSPRQEAAVGPKKTPPAKGS